MHGACEVTCAAALSLGAGCGDGKPSVSASMNEATVRGKVSIDGKPVTQGSVFFDAANYRRKLVPARQVPIAKDGTYARLYRIQFAAEHARA